MSAVMHSKFKNYRIILCGPEVKQSRFIDKKSPIREPKALVKGP
jgi:hypothetical protein